MQPGAPGQSSRTLSPAEIAALSAPAHTLADVAFMHRMIPHHEQALAMAALVAGRSTNRDVAALAERITVSQRDEIVQIERWLAERGEPHPRGGHDTSMPGMLTDQQVAELTRASGPAFDALFLADMIRHHEGALAMVRDLRAAGGGVEPAADRFAREVDADQSIEIARMRDLQSSVAH